MKSAGTFGGPKMSFHTASRCSEPGHHAAVQSTRPDFHATSASTLPFTLALVGGELRFGATLYLSALGIDLISSLFPRVGLCSLVTF
jgi:hypothetical protein